jgi:signal recognition particle receptor subunit alpha
VKENFCNLLKKKKLNTSTMGSIDINFEKEYQIILKTVEENSKKMIRPTEPKVKKVEEPKAQQILPLRTTTTNEVKVSTETDPYKQKLEEMKQKRKDAEEQKKNKKNPPGYIPPTKTVPKKKATKWNPEEYSKEEENELNKSKTETVDDDAKIEEAKSIYFSGGKESKMDDEDVYENITEDDIVITNNSEKKKSKGFFSYFTSLASGTVLDQEDLEPVLSQIKSNLQEKNVALTVSDEICKSVSENLIGKNIGTFSSFFLTRINFF